MIIYFTVTNDLNYDQRMIRICTCLANAGYTITLVGRKIQSSKPLVSQPFLQKRLPCIFKKGKIFYAEYNIRLFFYLLFKKMDCICAIDLDTILPCYFISKLRKVKRVYDAHELFCEMKEIITRPKIYTAWKKIEQFSVPKFISGYTVNHIIADEFKKMYGLKYDVIRNISIKTDIKIPEKKEKYILYQGAVNEGRCFESLIPAMKEVNTQLIICGNGNYFEEAMLLTKQNKVEDKIIFRGNILPEELKEVTLNAWIGITLFDDKSLSNYYSLANRFFDYMHAGIPQLCIDFPVYKEINDVHEVAVLIKDVSPKNLAKQVNKLLSDHPLYKRLQQNCLHAREILNWQNEQKKLINFYKKNLG